jgi:hypothetical protein
LLFLGCGVTRAEDKPNLVNQVKAAFLYNFTQFIDWPESAYASADAPFIVAVVGADPFNGELENAMEGKTEGGHAIVVKHFKSADDIGTCHLLFVPGTEDKNLTAIIQKLGSSPVLTVGESDAFPWADGVIRFFLESNKIRFEINPDAAEKAQLKVSSKLLKLARIFKK